MYEDRNTTSLGTVRVHQQHRDPTVMSIDEEIIDEEGTTTGFKLTLYRLLFVGLTSGLGSWKAVASYKNQATTMNTLDWVIGTIMTLAYVTSVSLSGKEIFMTLLVGSFLVRSARDLLHHPHMHGFSKSIIPLV